MKQNIDIEEFGYKSPFRVPDNYFSQLKSDIHKQTENLNFNPKFLEYFNLKTIAPAFALASIFLLITFNTLISNQAKNENVSIDEIYNQIIEFEIENIEEEYLFDLVLYEDYVYTEEIEYLVDNNTDYDLIIE